MAKPHDITGQRFGSLVAAEVAGRDLKHSYWRCRCDCGSTHIVTLNNLRRGRVESCGCQQRAKISDRLTTHGGSDTKLYRIWAAMKRRCSNPNVPEFGNYGGRGIRVCDRWADSFENFRADMGEPPIGGTLERIDNDGGYNPENCKWASRKEQCRNTRTARFVTVEGNRISLQEARESAGVPASVVYARIYRGWPEELWLKPKDYRR